MGGHLRDDVRQVVDRMRSLLGSKGFEFHPFKAGWYNDLVQPEYRLQCHYDTLAVLSLSAPSMFENAFIPYIREHGLTGNIDPLDECVAYYMGTIKKHFQNENIQVLHDFDMDSSMRPRMAIQTAGHVTGAVYYYQRTDLDEDPWGDQKIFGICVHPKYGGWFGLRAVFLFKDFLCKDLEKKNSIDILGSQKLKQQLLEYANFHWQDNRYRDIINVQERYSQEQVDYFNTATRKARLDLMKKYIKVDSYKNDCDHG
ncbi:hypothetical protein ScPMuIL_007041 [Solemya velum]